MVIHKMIEFFEIIFGQGLHSAHNRSYWESLKIDKNLLKQKY